MNFWQILGISPTKDLKAIKTAYSSKSREVHPEEHPEEFKQLHDAYMSAVKYARHSSNGNVRSFGSAVYEVEPKNNSVKVQEFQKEISPEAENESVDFSEVNKKNNENDADDIDFQRAIFMADERHKNEVLEKTEIVINEINQQYNHRMMLGSKASWLTLFRLDRVQELKNEKIFIDELCIFLKTHKNYSNIIDAIYEAFSLRLLTGEQDKGIYTELCDIIFHQRVEHEIRNDRKKQLTAYLLIIGVVVYCFVMLYFYSNHFTVFLVMLIILIAAFIALLGKNIAVRIENKKKR